MAELGLSTKDFTKKNGDMKSMADTFGLIQKHSAKMGATEKASVFHNLFGATGQQAGAILAENADQLGKLNEKVKDSAKNDYTGKLSAKNMQSAQNQINKFKQAASGLAITFAQTVLPSITKLAIGMGGLLEKFGKLDKSQKTMLTWTAITVAALAPAAKVVSVITTLGSAAIQTAKFVKRLAVSQDTLSASSTALAESEGAASAATTGASAGGGLLAKGKSLAGGLVKGVLVAGVGLDIGMQAVSAFKEGIGTKKGGQDLWGAAGKTTGAAIGGVLTGGNPVGIMIGEQAGNEFTKVVKASDFVKPDTHPDNTHNVHKKVDPNHTRSLHEGGENTWQDDASIAETMVEGGTGSNSSKHKKSSKPAKKKENPFDSLPKDARNATQTATQLVSSANKNWANAAADFSLKQTKKIKSDEASLLASNSAKYSKAYSALSGYVDKSTSKSTKAASFLEKIGATSASSAQKALSSQQSYNQAHLAAVKADYNAIEQDERSGGKNRVALIQKLNADLLKLTDKGGQKQRKLLSSLNSKTNKLSVEQYAAVTSESAKALAATKRNARKTYDSKVSAAQKEYDHTLKSAKQLYGVHSNEYKRIKGYAQKQYDETTDNAHNQYRKTVHWAEKQRAAVVEKAKEQAGEAADAFNTAAVNIGKSIPALLQSNAGLFGGHYQKPVSNTQSIKNNTNPGKKLANAAAESTGTGKKSGGISVNQGIMGHAAGGTIRKTGMAMVGENGSEVLQRGKQFSVIGARGAQLLQVRSGDRIYNHADVTKMSRGSFGQRLPNFANGTTQLASFVTGSGAATSGLNQKTSKNSISESKRMSKSVTKNYGDMSKKSASSLKQLNKKNASLWHDTRTDAESETTKLHKQAVNKFDEVKDDTVSALKSMHKQFNSVTTDLVSDFGSIFGKLKGQAHDGMAGAISSMNSGISSIDTTLAQFGGNKSVLKPIHYAAGSKGPIASDQLAVLNDATSGPRQELVARGSQLLKPVGKDVITPLKKGDEVFNGGQVEKAKPYLPHFKEGTGASDDKLISLASKNQKKPDAAWKQDFDDKTTKPKGSDLQRGLTTTAKGATDSVGPTWYKAGWNVINSAISGDGAGGNWAHSPGLTKTDGFNSSRGSGLHDGNDFSGAVGSAIHAVHGGKVIRVGYPPSSGWGAVGHSIVVKSDDGYEEIYQEYGMAKNAKVSVGDTVKTGQTVATLGHNNVGTPPHVHIGVSKGSVWNHGGFSHNGWYDVTKMHGKSSGVEKSKSKDTGVEKLFKQEIGKSALSWISKRLHVDDDSGSGGTSAAPSGSHKHWLEQAGIPASQFAAYNSIITPESGWNPTIHNPSSSAYGIPQALPGSKMASAGSDWKTNPITQLKWMKSYVNGRYGGIDKALAFRKVHGWYAKGGRPKVGEWSIVGEKGPELFKPDSAGTIYPHEKSKQIANQSISSTSRNGSKPKIDFHPTININIKGDAGGNVTKQQILKWVKEAMGESFEQLQDLLGGA